ncbi:cupin domain-containing protein [Pusillimonas noertemannii]|uniref:Gentisate 1,2-dioxygenase n=1 Tax=Pusillimonas noertemannii TaxID=305977 RepID=A0A2U1CJZ3_9BURK|nr:cupin domain-containing protein [Pusillimonas noertemannii]PVY61321.1 gentisate 1,2-dioxygenase [Pusillimonas noertemannii]
MTQGMIRELSAGTLPQLEQKLSEANLTPGWLKREKPLVWKEMRSELVPAHWSYRVARKHMVEAARLLGTEQAERRNFIMRNPVPGNDISTLRTIICAYQTILPGEKAMSHRHAPHAMRILLESKGGYSIVNGEKHPMESGDIVLTPGGCWHGHGHEGQEQAFWVDGLDVPLTHLLEPMFYEPHPERWETVTAHAQESPMRFTWTHIRDRLAAASPDCRSHFGATIELPAPTMPTLAIKVSQWPKGWHNRPFRHTANTVYIVMRGSGRSLVGNQAFDWEFGDTFTAPGWTRISHQVSDDAIVCVLSDENLMRWTRYYRFEEME